jgi:hypothetical protein
MSELWSPSELELRDLPQDGVLQARLETALADHLAQASGEGVRFRLASPDDELALRALYDAHPMHLSDFDLIYDRSPDFFSLMRARGVAHTLVVAERDGRLVGTGATSLRRGTWAGREDVLLAYLGDLRVAFDRRLMLRWRKFYAGCLLRFQRDVGVEAMLTAVLGDNLMAQQSLANERKRTPYRYASCGNLTMLNVLGRWRRPTPRGQVCWGEAALVDAQELRRADLLDHRVWAPGGVPVSVRDASGRPILALRIVSPDSRKRMRLSRTGRGFQMARSLSRTLGSPLPNEGESLRTLYAFQVTFATVLPGPLRAQALFDVAHTVMDQGELRAREIFALPLPATVGVVQAARAGLIAQATSVKLFEVEAIMDLGSSLHVPVGESPSRDVAFEMAWV